MKNESGRSKIYFRLRLAAVLVVLAAAVFYVWQPASTQKAASQADALKRIYDRPAPDFDLNESVNLPNARLATSEQLSALNALKSSTNATNMTARWNDFGGSPDVIYDFASAAHS